MQLCCQALAVWLGEFDCLHPAKTLLSLQRDSAHGKEACLPLCSSTHNSFQVGRRSRIPAQSPFPCSPCIFNPLPKQEQTAVRRVRIICSWSYVEELLCTFMAVNTVMICTYMQQFWYSCKSWSAASDTNEVGQSSFYHNAFPSSGVYTCIVLQRLWPNSFLPQGISAQLPHPSQSPNQNHISGQ